MKRISSFLIINCIAGIVFLFATSSNADPAKRPKPKACEGGHYGSVYPHNHSHEEEQTTETEEDSVVILHSEPKTVQKYPVTPVAEAQPYYKHQANSSNRVISVKTKSYQTRRQQLEMGVRVAAGKTDIEQEVAGIGAYLRVKENHLGFEVSVDTIAVAGTKETDPVVGRVPVLGAGIFSLNPRNPIRLYGLLGGGLTFQQSGFETSQVFTIQAGAGLDIDLSRRLSLSLDLRGLQDLEPASPESTSFSSQFGIATIGLSLKL